MKHLFSLFVVLALITACGGDEDESMISDPVVENGSALNQTQFYVGGDSAFVYESPEPLRFISRIECVDSCFTQTTSFVYDSQSRLDEMTIRWAANGHERTQRTVFKYSPTRIAYETAHLVDSTYVLRKDKGFVLMDRKGRAGRGSRMQWIKNDEGSTDCTLFGVRTDLLAPSQRTDGEQWIRCVTDFEYKYGDENDLRQVNQYVRYGNREFSERADVMWNVGNLSLVSDSRSDCSYLYGKAANKTNLDLNRYLTYVLQGTADCTDNLLGLLGVYGIRSARLCNEYADDNQTYRLQYELDDDGYVSRITVAREHNEGSYGVYAHSASEAWAQVGQSAERAQLTAKAEPDVQHPLTTNVAETPHTIIATAPSAEGRCVISVFYQ